jgi:uncharacterized protein (TIGR00730 family)
MSRDSIPPSGPVSLGDEESVKQLLVGTVFDLWKVVNNLTRLKPTRRDHYRVTIFGSARAKPGTLAYTETRRLAQVLTGMGCDIITGGGPGLMQAANEGACEANAGEHDSSIGIRIALPFEQDINPFVQQSFEHETFFTRLHHFVLASDAFIVAPGGIGTVLEAMMIWQLLQVGHLEGTPFLMVGRMWPGLVEWAREAMLSGDQPLANPDDMNLPRCLATADEAIEVIREQHALWLAGRSKTDQAV